MRSTKGVAQNDTQSDIQNGTQDDTQDGTQGVTQDVTHGVPQDVPQSVPQDKELDDWIEKQIRNNPQISTEDLAKLSNRSSRTLKRWLAKCHTSVIWVVVIVVIGRYLTKNKTTVAICDSGSNDLRQPKSTSCKYVGHVSHICFFLFQTHPPDVIYKQGITLHAPSGLLLSTVPVGKFATGTATTYTDTASAASGEG